MPELAAAYALGFISCLALTMLYVFLRERRRNSHGAKIVQANLAKLQYFWSDSADAIVPLKTSSAEDETKRSQRTIGYTGLILSLMSWAGVFFLLIIMLSERFFARSRRERRLFGSRTPSLTASDVRQEIDSLNILSESPAETARPI
jgi:hypothetical protein